MSSAKFCLPNIFCKVRGFLAESTSSGEPRTNLFPSCPIMTTVGEPSKEVLKTWPYLDSLSSNHRPFVLLLCFDEAKCLSYDGGTPETLLEHFWLVFDPLREVLTGDKQKSK